MVERDSSIGGGFVRVANTSSTIITYSDTGLKSGTQYSYRVSAINLVGIGFPSKIVSATPNDGIQVNNGKSDSHTYGWDHAVSLVKFTGLTPGNSIDKVAINVFSAAGNIRYKVYQDDGAEGSASTLLAESNSIPVTTGTAYNMLITPAIIPPSGNVWVGFEPDNNNMDAYYSLTTKVAQEWNYHKFGSGPNPFVLSGNNQIEFWAGIHITSSFSSPFTIANSTTSNPPSNVTVTNQVKTDLSENTNSSGTKIGIETKKKESKAVTQGNDLTHLNKKNKDKTHQKDGLKQNDK
jgi:hypothetical protein